MKKFRVKTGMSGLGDKCTDDITVIEAASFSVREDGVLIFKGENLKPVASFNKEEWISCTPVKEGDEG